MTELPSRVCSYCLQDQHHLARHDLEADCSCRNPRCFTDNQEREELDVLVSAGWAESVTDDELIADFNERVFDLGIQLQPEVSYG